MPDDVAKEIDAIVQQSEGLRARLLEERHSLLTRVNEIDTQLARLPRPRPPGATTSLVDWKRRHPLTPAEVGRPGMPINSRDVLHATAAYFGVSVAQINGPDRHATLARARHIAMYLARKLTGASFPELGIAFGSRDHTTVIAGVNKVESQLLEDSDVRTDVDALERVILEAKTDRVSQPTDAGVR